MTTSSGNNFHIWKMKMKICLHEKDLGDITLRKLLPQNIEFGKKVLDQGIHEEKQVGLGDNLLLKNYYYLLNHVNYVKNVKETWNKFYATFEQHVDNKL